MCEKLEEMATLVHDNLTNAQKKQKQWSAQNVREREFTEEAEAVVCPECEGEGVQRRRASANTTAYNHRYYRRVTGIVNGTISHQLSRTVLVAPEVRWKPRP